MPVAKSRELMGRSQLPSTIKNAHTPDELAYNVVASRIDLINQLIDPRRNIKHECGHPEIIREQDYRELYDREGIAARVVELLPRESWQLAPRIYESNDPEQTTPFEKRLEEVSQNLRGQSFFKNDEGSPLWEHLRRADELSGIGSFGVLLLGLNDGEDLQSPVEGKEGLDLIFLRAFDASLVQITKREQDVNSPRFGYPTEYNIQFENPQNTDDTLSVVSLKQKAVHWTRVIHLADNLQVSEIFGTPRMKTVFNRLLDLNKLYGGSAEMYWRGAFPGLSLETHPQLGGDVEIPAAAKDALEQYANSLQRYIAIGGVSTKSLAPQVVDPTKQIDVHLTAIAIRLGIPKRKLMGSERGELSSSQDDDEWNDKLKARQANYITPRVIVPFIDRLITLKILPEPGEDGYTVEWPDMHSIDDTTKAEIAVRRVDAMAKYVAGNVESLMAPIDFLTKELGFTDDEAKEILDKVEEVEVDDDIEQDLFEEEEFEDEEETEPEGEPDTRPIPGGDKGGDSSDKE